MDGRLKDGSNPVQQGANVRADFHEAAAIFHEATSKVRTDKVGTQLGALTAVPALRLARWVVIINPGHFASPDIRFTVREALQVWEPLSLALPHLLALAYLALVVTDKQTPPYLSPCNSSSPQNPPGHVFPEYNLPH